MAFLLCAAAPVVAQAGPPVRAAGRAAADRGASVMERLRNRSAARTLREEAAKVRPAADRPAADLPDAARPGGWRGTKASPVADLTPVDRFLAAPVLPRLAARPQDGADTPDAPPADEDDDLDPFDLLPDLGTGTGSDDGDAADDDAGANGRESLTPRARVQVRTPADLRKITDIRPFANYDPDPDPDDPCRNLCPRPPGCPPADDGDEPLCPVEQPLSRDLYAGRAMAPVRYRWAASNIAYNPLYFEDVPLERYGHHYGIFQPLVSAGKFGTQLVGLPYQMALDHPHKCVYPLGYYRPGDCAPKLHYQIPLNARAALVQAAAVGGIALVIP